MYRATHKERLFVAVLFAVLLPCRAAAYTLGLFLAAGAFICTDYHQFGHPLSAIVTRMCVLLRGAT